ncbi:hypothetical protein AB2C75_33025, partial [Pseudomonas aeruginosa]
ARHRSARDARTFVLRNGPVTANIFFGWDGSEKIRFFACEIPAGSASDGASKRRVPVVQRRSTS